jgi:hypothetical protein
MTSFIGTGTNQVPTNGSLGDLAFMNKDGVTLVNPKITNATFPAQINLTANSGYNIYASGTADNYLAGRISVGGLSFGGDYGDISNQRTITGAANTAAFGAITTVASDVTTIYSSFKSQPATQAASFTLGALSHFSAQQYTKGAGSTITYQYGYLADTSLTNGVNNYGFYGGIASGTGRYNLFMEGTADNYLAGSLGIGGGAVPSFAKVTVQGTYPTSSGYSQVFSASGAYPASTTTAAWGFVSASGTDGTAFTLPNILHFSAEPSSFGTTTVNQQSGFFAGPSLTGAVNNYGFYGAINAAAGKVRYNLYMGGTADNYLAGSLGIGTASPNASAILDVQSTTKGVRMPNMTTTQKNAIASPAAGLMVFDTNLAKLCVYTGAAWQTITSA